MSDNPKSFFQTFTGAITAITSLIIAVTGLYAATDGFNFSDKPDAQPVQKSQSVVSADEHKRQLEALKRQKEIDDLRIAQEKQKLLAEQEIATLKAKNAKLSQSLDNQTQTTISTISTNTDGQYQQTTSTHNLTGNWSYTNMAGTYTFQIRQDGTDIVLQEYDSYGNNVGSGSGFIEGNEVLLNWTEPYLFVMSIDAEAALIISPNGLAMSGNLYVDGNTMPMNMYRQ